MIQNKSIVHKRSSKIRFSKLLKKKVNMIIVKKSLTIPTLFGNLVDVTLQDCKFNFLPKEFGTLHHLKRVRLLRNCIINTTHSAWEWLEQASIRSNLKELKLSENHLTAVPLQISCMKNLQILGLAENKIDFLPKEFGILSQLITLDLTNNLLGISRNSTFEWLEAPIRHNLSQLDISTNFLTEFPFQITRIKNLQFLDISENKIDFLPKELGTLPRLTCLNLSSNRLGRSDFNTWEWLEQAAIRNKLSELYLCDNLLTELPSQIGKLNALTILKLIGNKLKYLPQSLANLKNLQVLDLYDNNLLYLPGGMAHLSTDIDVDENPFNLEIDNDDSDDLATNSEIPSLIECSADVILKSGFVAIIEILNYTNVLLPQELVRYLDKAKYCFFCKTPCVFHYENRFIKFSEYEKILNIKFDGTPNIMNASFKCYACSSECAKKLKN